MGKKSTNLKKATLFKDLTTLKTGGLISDFRKVSSKTDLKKAVLTSKYNKMQIFVIGEGSDILVGDSNYPGMVIKIVSGDIKVTKKRDFVLVTVLAGRTWDEFVSFCVKRNYQGVECLSGIPGTVGASPVQNIGAYGQEVADTITSLEVFDISQNKFVTKTKMECDFGYRESFFKKQENWQKYIIWSVTFKLKENNLPDVKYDSLKKYLEEKGIENPNLNDIREAVLFIRSQKFENYKKTPNAGSFFKNPVLDPDEFLRLSKKHGAIPCFENPDGTRKCFAGWFIEKAGWKGSMHKNAKVSDKHALVITNPKGKATASEIFELSEKIIEDVNGKFGVKLEREVQLINF